ncbi:MAG: Crp/Fnr family transcriptional regulator [Mailhella sp.]|nr:Crp/Fnr family transcriptional regulator [Mailhella sp.]
MEDQEKHPFLYIPCYTEKTSLCWEAMIPYGQKFIFKKGETFLLGTHKEEFGYIKQGLVSCYFKDQAGTVDEIRSFIGPGSLIKETLCACGYGKFQSRHKAITDVEIYLFDFGIIYQPSFFAEHIELIRNFHFSLAAKSLSYQFFSSVMKQKTISQKLAFYVYGHYLFNGRRNSFKPQLTQTLVADLMGVNNLTLNRVVAKWKRDGILACWTKNKMEILDIARIQELRYAEDSLV